MILTHIIANVSYYYSFQTNEKGFGAPFEMDMQQKLELQHLLFSRSMLNIHATVCILIHIATMLYFQNHIVTYDFVFLAI